MKLKHKVTGRDHKRTEKQMYEKPQKAKNRGFPYDYLELPPYFHPFLQKFV